MIYDLRLVLSEPLTDLDEALIRTLTDMHVPMTVEMVAIVDDPLRNLFSEDESESHSTPIRRLAVVPDWQEPGGEDRGA